MEYEIDNADIDRPATALADVLAYIEERRDHYHGTGQFPAATQVDHDLANAYSALADRLQPRVYFNGDTIPAGVKVLAENGDIYPDSFEDDGEEWDTANLGPLVEVTVDYAAEVARARAARKEDIDA